MLTSVELWKAPRGAFFVPIRLLTGVPLVDRFISLSFALGGQMALTPE